MKFSSLFLTGFIVLFFTMQCHAQQESIIYITPQQLFDNIKSNTNKGKVIQFWIPNCVKAQEIVDGYNILENEHSAEVEFYFIGITNKQSLVSSLIQNDHFKHKIYIADLSVNENIAERKESFSHQLCKLLNLKEIDFNTMYLNKKNKVIYYGDSIDVEKDKLEKISDSH